MTVAFGATGAAALTAQLQGKRTITQGVQARAGTNTLRWRLPKKLPAGRYSLSLLFEGTSRARTTIRVTR